MKLPIPIAVLAVLAAVLIATVAALPEDENARARAGIEALRVGEMEGLLVHETPLDEMTTAFADGDGAPVRIADFRGKAVVMNFWATWCAPCRAEMPSIDRLAGEMNGDDVQVLAVSTDRGGRERIDAFFAEVGIRTLAVYRDRKSDLAREAGAFGLPMTLLIGRDGREVARLIGEARWDGPEARAVVRRIAGE